MRKSSYSKSSSADFSEAIIAIKAEKLRRQAKTNTPPPSTARKDSWPPDYISVRAWRAAQCAKFELDPKLAASALSYYSNRPVEFINHWCDTFDPRNVGTGTPTHIPLIMFERQEDLVWAVLGCLDDKESGLTEKSRDMGASWICCALSVWLWRFRTGTAIGWGSRKAEYVDKIGDPKSIFWKSLDNVTPADAYFGRAQAIIKRRERIKRQTLEHRRLQHRRLAA